MASVVSVSQRLSHRTRERLWSTATATVLVAAAILLGIALAFVATLFKSSVAVFLALPLAPLLALAVLAAPIVAPLGVLATFPVGSTGAPIGAATLQSAEAAVLIVAMMIAVRRLAMGQTPLAWSPILYWPVALLAWMLVGMLDGLDETLAIKQLVTTTGGVVFAATILAACRGMRDVRVLLGGFVATGAVLAMTALTSAGDFQTRHGGAEVLKGRIEGAFDHPNQLGSFMTMAGAIAAGFVFGGRTRRSRLAALGALVALLATLALSLSRGAWIGGGVAALFLLATLPEARRRLLIAGLPIALAFLVLWNVVPKTEPVQVVTERAEAFTTLSPYDNRDAIWREAVREIKDEPWTGQGPGSFILASARAGSEASTVYAFHAHNIMLHWTAENGLPALAILICFALAVAVGVRSASRRARARGDTGDRAVMLGVGAALLAVVAQGVVDYTLGNPVAHLALWAVIGAVLVAYRDSAVEPRARARRR